MTHELLYYLNNWLLTELDAEANGSEISELHDVLVIGEDAEIHIDGYDLYISQIHNDSHQTHELKWGSIIYYITEV